MSRSRKVDPITSYLASVSMYIQTLPDDDVDDMLAEIREHLHASTKALVDLGWDPGVAPAEAIRRFGPAPRIGRKLIEGYPYSWAWERDKYGMATAPLVPRWLPVPLIFLCFSAGSHAASSLLIAVFMVIAAISGAISETLAIIRSAFEADPDMCARKSIASAKSLSRSRAGRILRLVGFEKLAISFRVAVGAAVPSNRSNSIGVLYASAMGVALLAGVYYHPTRPMPVVSYYYLAALVLGAHIARLAIHRYAKHLAS